MKINYHANNSGGGWWLKDEDWKHLEKAGWHVEWIPERSLGALAKEASKEVNSIGDALKEFEQITGQDVSDEGCNCCGPPHNFNWENDDGEYDSCSGERCLKYLFPNRNIPTSIREALEGK